MPVVDMDSAEVRRLAADPAAPRPWSGPAPDVVVRVRLDDDAAEGPAGPAPPEPASPVGVGAVVVGIPPERSAGSASARWPWCDVVVAAGPGRPGPDEVDDIDDVGRIVDTVERCPIAALALVTQLRAVEGATVAAGLVAESATYSTLLGGPEFVRWRRDRPARPIAPPSPDAAPVLAVRQGDELWLTLNRPARRNAVDATMRDALVELLGLVAADPSIRTVRIDGAGPDVCSGGDLDEFGSTPPALAHLVRLDRSVAALLHAVADRVEFHLHGACIGSGIEMASFAGRVVADASVRIALPEVSMGLIPGAGGTVGLTRRIGRQRTARLALTGATIDLDTALGWGLVDRRSPA